MARDVGVREVEVEAETWAEALRLLRAGYKVLADVIDEDGKPRPGYLVFVDGVDSRIAVPGRAREIVILPVNHGGLETLELSWSDVEELSYRVAEKIVRDGREVDVIVGVLRGGVIPARIIADVLGVPDLETVEVKLYERAGVRGKRPYIRRPLIGNINDKKVLVVDDISDSGLTLETVVNFLSLYGPRSLVTATLYIKPWTKFVPDYYAASTDKWVVFPWEKKEVERELGGSMK
ncbi:MAG: phosphoribosyltransferase family protein [Desulfurococcales archaeon]|nr:phosphoribosyltransferase family protein [Desulfurococcales archaeon]